jgi:site-specific recombinase XerD
MAKTPYVTDEQRKHMLKATAGHSKFKERDCALLRTLYGTALALTELAQITVADYINAKGVVRKESELRAEISNTGKKRGLYWVAPGLVAALDAYLAWRVAHRHGVTTMKAAYRSLDPESPIFLTDEGQPYALTKRVLASSGKLSYSCNTLGALITRLHADCGIHGGSAQSARRTFAINAYSQGYDLVHIAHILGQKSISSTKKMVEQNPVSLGDIVARVAGGSL